MVHLTYCLIATAALLSGIRSVTSETENTQWQDISVPTTGKNCSLYGYSGVCVPFIAQCPILEQQIRNVISVMLLFVMNDYSLACGTRGGFCCPDVGIREQRKPVVESIDHTVEDTKKLPSTDLKKKKVTFGTSSQTKQQVLVRIKYWKNVPPLKNGKKCALSGGQLGVCVSLIRHCPILEQQVRNVFADVAFRFTRVFIRACSADRKFHTGGYCCPDQPVAEEQTMENVNMLEEDRVELDQKIIKPSDATETTPKSNFSPTIAPTAEPMELVTVEDDKKEVDHNQIEQAVTEDETEPNLSTITETTTNLATNQSREGTTNETINQSKEETTNDTINQSTEETTNDTINQSTEETTNDTINHALESTTDLSTNQTTEAPTNLVINQTNNQSLNPNAKCGKITFVGGSASPYTQYGFPAYIGQFPWHVGIYKKSSNPKNETIGWDLKCAGSIISTKIVLSAAHCFKYNIRGKTVLHLEDKSQYLVAAGKRYSQLIHKFDVYSQDFRIKDIIFHEKWTGLTNDYQNDISIVILDGAVKFNEAVRPICIDFGVWNYDEEYNLAGKEARIASWGKTENSDARERLIVARYIYTDQQSCKKQSKLSKYVTDDKVCGSPKAKISDKSICMADCGGGLVVEDTQTKTFYLRGIASIGISFCGGQNFALFTRVSEHLEFIKNFI